MSAQDTKDRVKTGHSFLAELGMDESKAEMKL